MLENLFNMQAMLFILIIVGILLYKTGVVTDEGQRCLTDMTLDVIIPCNIITSFMIEMSGEILRKCFSALVVSVVIQIGYTILSHTLYNRYGTEKKKVLQFSVGEMFLQSPRSSVTELLNVCLQLCSALSKDLTV